MLVDMRRGFDPGVGKIPCRRACQPTPVFLPGESRGQRSLSGYIVHGVAESRTRLKRLSIQHACNFRQWWGFWRKMEQSEEGHCWKGVCTGGPSSSYFQNFARTVRSIVTQEEEIRQMRSPYFSLQKFRWPLLNGWPVEAFLARWQFLKCHHSSVIQESEMSEGAMCRSEGKACQ